ncbi:hypothetical protein P22_0352 [Propionispora sp. 2/2-37]|uniref:DNA repair protein RecN n=1 Tax=Propionispora sp. 2/2-37 TaxID=1677858 RepID=UPI0006BB99DF|nr:DNA repair protein RecN [Propionispora sp. 2/2-37]CUH94286.1 hypothetical protein P22_0352 [Propionispora sp. 2/2-37]
MLKSLTITNFALIEQITIEFSSGLNVLSGETGAGKSIIIDALNTVLGSRASNDFIRAGTDFFRVEAMFAIAPAHPVYTLLDEQNIAWEEADHLIISRKFTRNGKNSIVVNDCHVTLATLRQIGEMLVDMHGQHENQSLLRTDVHLALLDLFNHADKTLLETYQKLFQEWSSITQELSLKEVSARERAQRLDMLEWQTKEISDAALRMAEDEKIEEELRFLSHSEKITRVIQQVYFLLREGVHDTGGVLSQLTEVKKELESIERFDKNLRPILSAVTDALYQLEESALEVSNYQESIEFNPQRLVSLQERMDTIYRLKKKYGATITEILDYYQQANNELEQIKSYDQRLEELINKRDAIYREMEDIAEQLDQKRRKAAREMSKQITEQLSHLGMPKAFFCVDITVVPQFNNRGRNEVRFLFSANPGEEPKPLHKVASGGELSRIALSIKTVFAQKDEIATLIFDEVDAGVGGQMAQKIAERMSLVALHKQVLCITHLPQIACMADWHIYIEKTNQEGRSKTHVRILDRTARLTELARMTSGNEITAIALENAEQMLTNALQKKEKWKKEEKS